MPQTPSVLDYRQKIEVLLKRGTGKVQKHKAKRLIAHFLRRA